MRDGDAGPWAVLTPSNSINQPLGIRGVYIGGTPGNLVVDFGAGNVSIPVLANTIYPMKGVVKIDTSSTATPLYGIFG